MQTFAEVYLNLDNIGRFLTKQNKNAISITCRRFRPEKKYKMRIMNDCKVIYGCGICGNFVEEVLIIRNLCACEQCSYSILSTKKFIELEPTYYS